MSDLRRIAELAASGAVGSDGDKPAPPRHPADTADSENRPAFIRATNVRSELQRWAWRDRLPLGEITIVGGIEKRGKSTGMVWVSARITRGDLPGDLDGTPRGIIYVSGEDHAGRVLKPRLDAAGADLSRVFFLDPEGPGFSVAAVEGLVATEGIAVVVLDPLSLFVDVMAAHENGEIATRKALAPLVVLSQRHSLAIPGVKHLRKDPSGHNPFDAIIGSRGYTAAARSVLFFTGDPEYPDRAGGLVFARGNLAGASAGLRYRLDIHDILLDDGNIGHHPVFTIDEAISTARLEDVLAGTDDSKPSATDDCADWLTDLLGEGRIDSVDVKRKARSEQFSERVLRDARERLGVVIDRVGFGRGQSSWWSLPASTHDVDTPLMTSPGEGHECASKVMSGDPERSPDLVSCLADELDAKFRDREGDLETDTREIPNVRRTDTQNAPGTDANTQSAVDDLMRDAFPGTAVEPFE